MRRYIVTLVGVGLVAAGLSVTTGVPAVAQGALKPLAALIVNDVNNPVPVSVTGQLTSSLTPLFVRNVNEPADEPLQTELCFPPGSTHCTSQGVSSGFTVPTVASSGRPVRRMVVEYVSGTCFGGLQFFEAQVHSVVNGGDVVRHHVVPVPGEAGWLNIAQPVRIYADPGTLVRISGTTNGLGACGLAVSGHLVAN